MSISRWGTAAFATVSALLACPSLLAQSFTFGPTHVITLPAQDVTDMVTPLDMNGDGNTDLYVSLSTGNYIYLGNGTGSFSTTPVKANESGGGGFQVSPVFYDVNGDGFADEVIAYPGNNDPSGRDSYPGVFAVLLGDGKGNFTETTRLFLGDADVSRPLVAGDFNHDGKLDFATAYPGSPTQGPSTLTVFLNTGGGKFQVGLSTTVTGSPNGLASGDFNGDGKLDLVWADGAPEGSSKNAFAVHCLYGNGNGTFRPDQVCYTLDGAPESVAVADFNRDGKADLEVSTLERLDANGNPVTGAKPRMATLLAKSGGFAWSSSVSTPTAFAFLQILDMNGDGFPDLVASGDTLFKGNANGVFSPPQPAPTIFSAAFAPLRKGGLPALFYIDGSSAANGFSLDYRINTSPK